MRGGWRDWTTRQVRPVHERRFRLWPPTFTPRPLLRWCVPNRRSVGALLGNQFYAHRHFHLVELLVECRPARSWDFDHAHVVEGPSIRIERASEGLGLLVSEATDEGLVSAVRRSNDGEELSPDDRFRLDRISCAYFRYWENAHYQYRNGLYDEKEFAGAREAWKYRLSRPGVAAIWCDSVEVYSPEFVAEIERLLPSGSSCAKAANPR